jgi:signal transduction histidine kinase/CheY-like chemotaxis protein/HPt (histidine-containing phosphotransfer) domain-containing protein
MFRRFFRSGLWQDARSQRHVIALAGFGAAIIGAVLGLYLWQLMLRIDAAVGTAGKAAHNLAEVLAEHTARTFEGIERALRAGETVRRDFIEGRHNAEAARAALEQLARTSPAIIAIGWTDAAGEIEVHSYPGGRAPRTSIADLPQFYEQKAPSSRALFVAPPYRSAATGRNITAASRRLSHADDSFAGAIVAPLDQTYFDGIYALLDIGPHGAVALVHTDGLVLTRVPHSDQAYGRSFRDTPMLNDQLPATSSGSYESVSPIDGTRRIYGYKRVAGLPLAVVVTYRRSDVLAPLLDQAKVFAPLVAILLLLIAIGTVLLIRQARELAAKRVTLAATLDTMDQGLIMLDESGRIPVYNQRALSLLGLPESLLKSRPTGDDLFAWQQAQGEFHDFTPPPHARLNPAIRGEPASIYERTRPNGITLEIRTAPLPSGGVVRTYTDISERKAIERALDAARQRAEAAAKAKSEFLANMSHELRTPLTAIIGVSDFLIAGEHPAEERKRFLAMQRDAGEGLLAIISDILDFSKIEAGQIALESVSFDLGAEIATCIALVDDSAKRKGLRLASHIGPGVPPRVCADPTRLRQVLLNLLSNATKFTHEGSVSLTVSADADRPGILHFAVTDTGIGIPAERVERLFQRFTQADTSTTREFGGSGLGLAISRELVALMGGRLSVTSSVGKGSTFAFAIEVDRSGDGQFESAGDDAVSADRTLTILLAEDNETNSALIAAMLARRGHRVVTARNGAEAVACASAQSFDIILMDIHMPELDGYGAARSIRAAEAGNRRVPIIALTANAMPEEEAKCREAGMDLQALKPVDWPFLLGAIDRLTARRASSDPAVPPEPLHAPPGVQQFDQAIFDRLHFAVGAANVRKLLGLFVADAASRFEGLEPQRDPSVLATDAHSLGGVAGMLGFAGLTDACRALQDATGRGDASAALARCRAARDLAVDHAHRLLGTLVDDMAPSLWHGATTISDG